MQRLQQGNQKAFELLYDRYCPKLVHFCARLLGETQHAEDIVQELFIKIIKHPAAFDSNRNFSTWIYTLAKNACFNAKRDAQNRADLLQKNVGDGTENPHTSRYDQ